MALPASFVSHLLEVSSQSVILAIVITIGVAVSDPA